MPDAPGDEMRERCAACSRRRGDHVNIAHDFVGRTPATDTPAETREDMGRYSEFVRACRVIAKYHNNRDCACEFCCYLVNTGYWYDGWGKRALSVPVQGEP